MKVLMVIAATMGIAGISLGDIVLGSLGFVGLTSALLDLDPSRIQKARLD